MINDFCCTRRLRTRKCQELVSKQALLCVLGLQKHVVPRPQSNETSLSLHCSASKVVTTNILVILVLAKCRSTVLYCFNKVRLAFDMWRKLLWSDRVVCFLVSCVFLCMYSSKNYALRKDAERYTRNSHDNLNGTRPVVNWNQGFCRL